MTLLSSIEGDYIGGKGRLYIQLSGANRMEEVGDVDEFTVSLENERLERFSNAYGVRTKSDSRLIQQNASISFTPMQNTARNICMALMSTKAFLAQGSASSQTHIVTGVVTGDIVDVGKLDITVNSISDGAPPTGLYPTGHYEYDTKSGLVKILNIPTGVGANATITYAAAAIPTGARRLKIGGGSEPDLEAKLVFIALDANSNPIEKITVHKVKLAPNGDWNLISDEYRSLPISGEVIVDESKETGFKLYQLEDLATRTNTGVAD